MKKLKIMLMSLALVAVLGGALAFKAKFDKDYCTAPTETNKACTQIFCGNQRLLSTPAASGVKICTTTKPVAGCAGILCTTTTTFPLVAD